jgi:hypothetical protein
MLLLRPLLWILAFALTIGGVQAIQLRFNDEFPPSWTYLEYIRRLESVDPKRDFVFLGDSRAGWGIAENAVTAALHACHIKANAWNLGSAAAGLGGLSDTFFANTPKSASGTLILNYGPGFLFHFTSGRGGRRLERSVRFNVIDEFVNQVSERFIRGSIKDVPERIMKLVRGDPPSPHPFWASRTVYGDGFVQGVLLRPKGQPVDFRQLQIDYYKEIVEGIWSNTKRREERLSQFADVVRLARKIGWKVVMIRLPVGAEMRKIEATLPPETTFSALAKAYSLTAIDYNDDPRTLHIESTDQSHLSPDGAIAIAPVIASDMAKLSGIDCPPSRSK